MTGENAGGDTARARRLWFGALSFFVLVKLVWAMLPAHVMGLPRLGDDALVYLWVASGSVVSPRLGEPAIRDIVAIRNGTGTISPELEFARARATMRTTNVSASPVALATAGALAAGLDPKWAFAAAEGATALVLALAIGFSIATLASRKAAAAALALLAFAILPNQGLHYLVPSVFDLALALVLWTLVLCRPGAWPAVAVLAAAMLLTHPIGQVYVLTAFALVCGAALMGKRLAKESAMDAAALAVGVVAWKLVEAFAGVRHPETAGLGGLSLSAIGLNAWGLAGHAGKLAVTQPFLFVLLAAGIWRALARPARAPRVFVLVGVLCCVVASTVIVDIPGYPGELPSRVLVALLIVCCGVSAQWFIETAARRPALGKWGLGALCIAVAAQVPMFVVQLKDNVNSRHQIYASQVLRAEIAQFGDSTTVIWADADVAMMAALIGGAYRLNALPMPMFASPAEIKAAIRGGGPVVAGTTAPERLNGLSTIGAWSVTPRFYGYDFGHFRRVSVYAGAGAALPGFVRIENGGAADLIATAAGGARCGVRPAAGEASGWFALEGCAAGEALHFQSAAPALRITGLSLASPAYQRRWPWGSDLRLRAEPLSGAEAPEIRFTFDSLLGERQASALREVLGPLALRSDASGIIWIEAAPASRRETP